MYHPTNRFKFVFLFIGVAMLFTACSSDNNLATQGDVDKLTKKIDQLSQQIDNFSSTTLQPATEVATSPTITTTVVAPPNNEEVDSALLNCLEVQQNWEQMMIAIGVPDGAHFTGSCYSGEWGVVFSGTPGDSWNIELRGTAPEYVDGVAQIPFTATDGTVPTGKKHPAYADALTIEQMMAGTTVCAQQGTLRGQTSVVAGLVLVAYERTGEVTASWVDSNGHTWSLESDGVIPYTDGTWSTTRLVAGVCP